MSAKRYKTSTYRRPDDDDKASHRSLASASPSIPVNPLFDMTQGERDAVISFCNAVELQFIREKKNRLALSVCYALVSKTAGLSLPALPPRNETEWTHDHQMFLYKFLYVTGAVQMFQLVRDTATRRWWVQRCDDGRIHLVRMAVLDPACINPDNRSSNASNVPRLSSADEEKIRQAMRSLQRNNPPAAQSTSSSSGRTRTATSAAASTTTAATTKAAPDNKTAATTTAATITAPPVMVSPATPDGSTTVEERIRAKQEARRQREQAAEDRLWSGSAAAHKDDETWRVRVADMLWFHVSQVQHRHHQFASPSRRRTPGPTCLVVEDARKLVEQQSQAMAGQKLRGGAILAHLRALCKQVPEWIRRSAAKGGPDDEGWDPTDTIWISPVDYQIIRRRLLGQPAPPTPSARTPLGGTKRDWSQVQAANVEKTRIDPAATKPTVDLRKRPLNALLSVTRREASLQATQERSTAADDDKSKDRVVSTEQDASLDDMTTNGSPKRMRLQGKATVARRPKLRVNPHLIMTDADHQGGERIFPSRKDSPRGLKNLFHQLNAGKRI